MMVDEKLIKLFEFYSKGEAGGNWLSSQPPEKFGHVAYEEHWTFDKLSDYEAARRHAAWMAVECISCIKEAQSIEKEREARAEDLHGAANIDPILDDVKLLHLKARSKREKAHRWLGFIQATLFFCGAFTLNELKEHSRSCSDDFDADANDDKAMMDDDARKSSR